MPRHLFEQVVLETTIAAQIQHLDIPCLGKEPHHKRSAVCVQFEARVGVPPISQIQLQNFQPLECGIEASEPRCQTFQAANTDRTVVVSVVNGDDFDMYI